MKTRRRAEKKAIWPPNTLLQPGFSRLTRQVKDWEEDLQEVNEPQSESPRLIRVNQIIHQTTTILNKITGCDAVTSRKRKLDRRTYPGT